MITLILAAWVALPPIDPGLPTPPPPQPTYIVNDDGTHTTCAPNYYSCDWSTS